MQNHSDRPDYRGLRALILTRVSTVKQQENNSHAAQERQVREKLIIPLGLRIMDEKKHIIHDTYSGLEYRYRKALDDILEMAERGEFDLLCMDVLDRGLGRRALPRELFRMQLRELGIRILTTQESDHADDDSLEGQIMRFFKGYKAEEEVNDFVRRTRDGKGEKALGDPEKKKPQQIVGSGYRLYGYKFVTNAKGVRVGYELNLDVIFVDEDGTEWTEVTVVRFIFESAADGVSIHQIASLFNTKGIPTPYETKGKRMKGMKDELFWQHDTIRHILKNTGYYGEYRHFRTAPDGRKPGYKRPARRFTTEDEQVIISIPAIVTKDLFEKATSRVTRNKQLATRNNQTSRETLMRGGFAKCAYCAHSLRIKRFVHTQPSTGNEVAYFYYECDKCFLKGGKCPGCTTPVDQIDSGVAEYIMKLIRDPSDVDKKIQKLLVENPAHKQQQRKLKNLNTILREKETFRNNLAHEMRKKRLSEETVAFLNTQLAMLEEQEQEARIDLADQQRMQEKEEKLQQRIAEFHRQCQLWREKVDDPEFTPTFKFLQDAVLFFGISVTVWKAGTLPRYEIYTDPPEIVELLSSMTFRP